MNVLVTGASTGIGRATALLLAERGATVYAGVRNPADGEALGPTVRPITLDITNPDDVGALARARASTGSSTTPGSRSRARSSTCRSTSCAASSRSTRSRSSP